MGIAERRHHNARIKKNRLNYWGFGLWRKENMDKKRQGICLSTPKPCSCIVCCNNRKSEGLSLDERRNNAYFQCEMLDYPAQNDSHF